MIKIFIRQRRGVTRTAGASVALLMVFLGVRLIRPAQAVSSGSPYVVPLVTDTNADPNIVETTIIAEPAAVDVGNGVTASVLTYNGTVPGPEIRTKVGDTVIVHFINHLGHATGIHWHGIELDNASDGTPLSQNMVPEGGSFLYKFKVHRPGVYWYHPHHHSSTNQVFKGLYGSLIVVDPNEAALQAAGVLPSPSQTKTMVLADATVCKAVGSNDTVTYDASLPHVSGGVLPMQSDPWPINLCETAPIDEDGNPRAAYAAGDVPNIQRSAPDFKPINEGQTVLTNGKNVGGRAGTPAAPGALAVGAQTLSVQAGQGVRMQFINAAATRFFRLILTDNAGTQIPLVRVGGQGGLLDNAVLDGGIIGGFDFLYNSGEILVDPGDRADVVAAIPASATGVLTLWTQDFKRTGPGFANIPTVPVAHFSVSGAAAPVYTIAAGTPLRAATGDLVEALGPATNAVLDPATFTPPKSGLATSDFQLTNAFGGPLGINGKQGSHDFPGDYTAVPHELSARYAVAIGDTLELTTTNLTGAHHPFHLHGFSIQPLSFTKTSSPTYTFPYHEFRDNIDVPNGYTLHYRLRLDDRPMMDGVTPGGGLGRWVLHCHIFFHAVFGMIGEFDVVGAGGNERPYINTNNTLLTGRMGDPFTMHGTYVEPDGNPVTLSASAGTIVDNGGGQWTWSATGLASGLVYVTATDNHGLKDQVAFALQNCPAAAMACFTDEPLEAGVTPIRTVYITELRDRINADRHAYGFPALTWTDPVLTGGVTLLKVQHLAELRSGVDGLYQIAGMQTPTYTDASIQPGLLGVRTVHIEDLRAALVQFEIARGITPSSLASAQAQ